MQEYMEEDYSCKLTPSFAYIFEKDSNTHTHSPGLEQFPFLSLQPSRQIAKKKRKGGKKNIFITSSYYVSLTKATEIFVSYRSKPVLHTPSCQGEWEGEFKKKKIG